MEKLLANHEVSLDVQEAIAAHYVNEEYARALAVSTLAEIAVSGEDRDRLAAAAKLLEVTSKRPQGPQRGDVILNITQGVKDTFEAAKIIDVEGEEKE